MSYIKNYNCQCLLSDLLQTITPKERKEKTTFHDMIECNQNALKGVIGSSPPFEDILTRCEIKKITPKKVYKIRPTIKKTIEAFVKQNTDLVLGSKRNPTMRPSKSTNDIILPKVVKKKPIADLSSIIDKNDYELIEDIKNQYEIIFGDIKEKQPINLMATKTLPWFMHSSQDKDRDNGEGNSTNNNNEAKNDDIKPIHKNYLSLSTNNRTDIYDSAKKYKILTPSNAFQPLRELYSKCAKNIKRGKSIDKYIGRKCNKFDLEYKKSHESLNQNSSPINDRQNLCILNDDRKQKEMSRYVRKTQEIINNRKKRLNQNISEQYAFTNRAEFAKYLKDYTSDDPYALYLAELNDHNNAKILRKSKEKSDIELVSTLLDKTYKEKEYLKAKIEENQERHHAMNKSLSGVVIYPHINDYFTKAHTTKAKDSSMINRKSFAQISREAYEEIRNEYKKNKIGR